MEQALDRSQHADKVKSYMGENVVVQNGAEEQMSSVAGRHHHTHFQIQSSCSMHLHMSLGALNVGAVLGQHGYHPFEGNTGKKGLFSTWEYALESG